MIRYSVIDANATAATPSETRQWFKASQIGALPFGWLTLLPSLAPHHNLVALRAHQARFGRSLRAQRRLVDDQNVQNIARAQKTPQRVPRATRRRFRGRR